MSFIDRILITGTIQSTNIFQICNEKQKKIQNYMIKMEEQIDYQSQHYSSIVNEVKKYILSIEKENQSSFTDFSQIMR